MDHPANFHSITYIFVYNILFVNRIRQESRPNQGIPIGAHPLVNARDDPLGFGVVGVHLQIAAAQLLLTGGRRMDRGGGRMICVRVEHRGEQPFKGPVGEQYYICPVRHAARSSLPGRSQADPQR